MSYAFKPTTAITDIERRQLEKRIKMLRNDPVFLTQLREIKQYIKAGTDLDEIKSKMQVNITGKTRWNDLLHVLQQMECKEHLMMEWAIRARDRYKLANRAYVEAQGIGNLTQKNKAVLGSIMLMQKADEHTLYLYEKLGLLERQPINPENPADGDGYANTDLDAIEAKIRKELDDNIRDQLSLEKQASAPVDIALLEAPKPRGEADTLEPIAVDAESTGGSE